MNLKENIEIQKENYKIFKRDQEKIIGD